MMRARRLLQSRSHCSSKGIQKCRDSGSLAVLKDSWDRAEDVEVYLLGVREGP